MRLSLLICFVFVGCAGRALQSNNITEKVIGVLLAIFFGPIYFIYLYYNSGYCVKDKKNSNNNNSNNRRSYNNNNNRRTYNNNNKRNSQK